MDQESQAMLDAILAKEPAALTDEDKAFLRARRSYLNTEQRTIYAEVLADVPGEPATEEAKTDETEPEATKKGKKAKTDETES